MNDSIEPYSLPSIARPSDEVQQMIKANDYEAFRRAVQEQNNESVISYLLSFPTQFAYAEQHVREYGKKIVQPYIESTLIHLKQKKAAFETESPQGVFDVDSLTEAELYYLMIRHFIRTPGNLENMQWLLNIPAVKARVANNNNELLRLALTLHNHDAAALLLMFPDVHTLAQADDYYCNELGSRIDLAELAHDRESSMRALTPGEQVILDKAIQYYKPRIIQHGAAAIIDELRTQLAERFMSSGTNLPLTWNEFQKLHLSADERQRAFATYYKNPNHTAWRYLQKPNPWMNAQASYVYVNPDATHERWSTFEEYLPEIALMYLGANDSAQPTLDGFTVESRFEHFISELALINRALNWDHKRQKRDARGQWRTEEFDDLEGDRPSCYSGVKRRLFQSVLGHPLFKLVRLDEIKQMLASRMREHFQQFITDDNKLQLANAWRVVLGLADCDDMTEKDARECMAALNLPKQTQEEWLAMQQGAHAAFFELNPNFTHYIQQQFKLTAQFPTHAERFGGATSLTELLSITAEITEALAVPTLNPMEVKLQTLGECGQALLDEINSLRHAASRRNHPLGEAKLQAVTQAVQQLPDELSSEEFIQDHLNNQNSALYIALDSQGPPGDKQLINTLFETVEAATSSKGPKR